MATKAPKKTHRAELVAAIKEDFQKGMSRTDIRKKHHVSIHFLVNVLAGNTERCAHCNNPFYQNAPDTRFGSPECYYAYIREAGR